MTQGLIAYDAKAKRDWRGWQWNRIAERLAVPVENATVLYLCGPDDIDREKAVARGFRNENLIAIDIVRANIVRARNAGGFGIAHDFLDVLWAWPDEWPIDVIVADWCSGFTGGALTFLQALFFSPASANAVVAVNLMRGRDASSNELRAHATAMLRAMPQIPRSFFSGVNDIAKHRGLHFAVWATNAWHSRCGSKMLGLEESARLTNAYLASAAFMSYTSSGRTGFDTAVFNWPGVHARFRQKTLDIGPSTARRKIAALRAIRTMRKEA